MMLVRLVTFYLYGLYNRLWRYAGINELISIVNAVTVSSLVIVSYMYMVGATLPRSVHILSWLFTIATVGASRIGVRILHHIRLQKQTSGKQCNVLIVGAGDAGAMIARELQQRYYEEKHLVGFIDDSEYKQNQQLYGTKVLGNHQDIPEIIAQYQVDEIIIAIPSINGHVLRDIVRVCKSTKCRTQIIPGLYELIDGKVSIQQLRDVALEDLLRRNPVELDLDKITEYLRGKRVLVTGAGGSIGSELCRQIARQKPGHLYLLGKGENSIYDIQTELQMKYLDLATSPIIADIRDKGRIEMIFLRIQARSCFSCGRAQARPVDGRTSIRGNRQQHLWHQERG